MNEFEFIENLTNFLDIKDKNVLVGFGDDCAVIKCGDKNLLFTNDCLVEDVHFIKSKILPEDLGWKLVSVNVSDIVSSGGYPRWANITVALSNKDIDYLKYVYKGIRKALDFYKFSLVGGNTSKSDRLFLDMFLVGETDRYILRDGAEVGDFVYISGKLGLSRAGLELLLMNKDNYEDFELELIKYHTKPLARIDLVELIKNNASSCIDISDGLVGDLNHISHKSKKMIILEEEKIPIHELLKLYCEKYNKNPLDYILYGGEDYQLAFTSRSDLKDCIKIGYVEEGEGIYLKSDGKLKKLKGYSFSHL